MQTAVIAQSWKEILPAANLVPAGGMIQGTFFGDTGFVLGSSGNIYKSNDFFETNSIDSTYKGTRVKTLTFVGRDTGYITSNYVMGGMLRTTDGGNSWWPMPTGLPAGEDVGYMTAFSSSESGYGAFYSSSEILKTNNGGVTWSLGYTFCSCYFTVCFKMLNDSVFYVIGKSSYQYYSPGNLYLLRSTDRCQTWQQLSMLPGISTYADLGFIDDTTLIVACRNAILKSNDGGLSFQTVFSSNLSEDRVAYYYGVISFVDRDTGFVGFGGNVYRTYDGGNSWQRTERPLKPTQSNAILFLRAVSSQKIIVGCERGNLYKTETGGGDWLGVDEPPAEPVIAVYPNPAKSNLQVTGITGAMQAQVFSIDGRLVKELWLDKGENEIDISALSTGLYVLQLKSGTQQVVRKFVKE
ncbi:MAG: YCF48-related protein [Chitinophagales bacterium]